MRDSLIVSALSLVPRNRAAWLMGWFARTGLSKVIIRWFVRTYGLDMSEAQGDVGDFDSLESLFTRRLLPGRRPIDDTEHAMVSPCDGEVAWAGTTEGGQFDIAPGRPLTIAGLLDMPYEGEADVAVIYLSPKDYHRVHSPVDGKVTWWSYLPGTLWPVFPAAVRSITGLFAKNERTNAHIEGPTGPLDVVLVGAFGVGRMSMAFTDLLTNTGGSKTVQQMDPAFELARGDDLGAFHLGSTVVLIAPAGSWHWKRSAGEMVKMGELFATRR